MSDGTHIEWTDATLNVVNGCTVVSPGCANCYAMRLAATRLKHHPSRAGLARVHNGHPQWTGEVRFNEKVLLDPLRWRRPRKIFWNAHGDLFHPSVPTEWIDRCLAVMALTPQHIHQVLTKRHERMRHYASGDGLVGGPSGRAVRVWNRADAIACEQRLNEHHPSAAYLDRGPDGAWPLPNVWLGVSVEDQKRADERIPILLDTPAAVRWLSCEPLLGPVDLTAFMPPAHHHPANVRSAALDQLVAAARASIRDLHPDAKAIDWVVCGGESGPGARPMHPAWARSLRDQCAAAGVPFLFKQWGEWGPVEDDADDRFVRQWVFPPTSAKFGPVDRTTDVLMHRPGKKRAGRLLDGVQHDGYPA